MVILSMLLVTLNAPFAASDSVRITFPEVRSAVLAHNYLLSAEKQEVQALYSDAKQNGLIENPQLNAEVPLYTGGRSAWFDVGKQGQYALSVEQTIPWTGARSALQDAGEYRAKSAESSYDQHRRSIVFESLSAYSSMVYGQESLESLTRQLALLRSLIDGFDEQVPKGNVALRDALRIKAAYYTINSHRTGVLEDIRTARAFLQSATGMSELLVAQRTNTDTVGLMAILTSDANALVDSALLQRSDIQSALMALKAAEADRSAENKKALPDPTLGLMYDRAGSYSTDYYALTLNLPIPAIDRHQWSKEAATARIMEAQAQIDHLRATAKAQIVAAVDRLRSINSELLEVDQNYVQQADSLTEGIIENYRRGNVSLLDFVDFIETYNESIVRINALKAERAIALGYVHLVMGENPNGI